MTADSAVFQGHEKSAWIKAYEQVFWFGTPDEHRKLVSEFGRRILHPFCDVNSVDYDGYEFRKDGARWSTDSAASLLKFMSAYDYRVTSQSYKAGSRTPEYHRLAERGVTEDYTTASQRKPFFVHMGRHYEVRAHPKSCTVQLTPATHAHAPLAYAHLAVRIPSLREPRLRVVEAAP